MDGIQRLVTGSFQKERFEKSVDNKTDDRFVNLTSKDEKAVLSDLLGAENAVSAERNKDIYLAVKDTRNNTVWLKVNLGSPEGMKMVQDIRDQVLNTGDDFKLADIKLLNTTKGEKLFFNVHSEITQDINSPGLKAQLKNIDKLSGEDIQKILTDTKFGQNVLKTLNIKDPDLSKMTKEEKGAVASTLGMVKLRNEFLEKYSGVATDGIKLIGSDSGKMDSRTVDRHLENIKKDYRYSSETLKAKFTEFSKMITENPDMPLGEKIENLGKIRNAIYTSGMPSQMKTELVKNEALDPRTPAMQNEITSQITEKAKQIYSKMGENPESMPHQYLAGSGGGSGTAGIANTPGGEDVGVGYFMYGREKSSNQISLKVPQGEDLKILAGSYGFDSTESKTKMTMTVGNKPINFTIQNNQITVDETSKKALKETGVKINENNFVIPKSYAGTVVNIKLESQPLYELPPGAKGDPFDEVQVHFSANAAIQVGTESFEVKQHFANNKFDIPLNKFKAEQLSTEEINKVKSLAKNLDNVVFEVSGHGIENSVKNKNYQTTPAADKKEARHSEITLIPPQEKGGKFTFRIDGFTDNDPVNATKYNVPEALETLKDGNNNNLSALRSLSTLKALLQSSLSETEYAKIKDQAVTVSVPGKEKISVKIDDIPGIQ